jgi:hypothetical protein
LSQSSVGMCERPLSSSPTFSAAWARVKFEGRPDVRWENRRRPLWVEKPSSPLLKAVVGRTSQPGCGQAHQPRRHGRVRSGGTVDSHRRGRPRPCIGPAIIRYQLVTSQTQSEAAGQSSSCWAVAASPRCTPFCQHSSLTP